MTFSGQRYRVTDTDRREFAVGRTQAYYYELFGDAGSLVLDHPKQLSSQQGF